MNPDNPVGFQLKPPPAWIRAANALGRALGSGSESLQPELLMAEAARRAGLPPRFPAHVDEALDVLCRSLRDDARLHWFGATNTRSLLVTGLAAMLEIERVFADDPALAAEPLSRPIFVVGLPRSGTTFLHRLLSAAPDAVGVPLHRHLLPVTRSSLDLRRLEARVKFSPWRSASRVYGLDAIHYVRPDLPDECNFGMRLAGRSMIYWATNPVHGYLRWLLAQDLRESYQLYRKALILHQRASPGRRLTLKCPHHLAWLPALVEAIPEAVIVQTHRDPVEVLPSESKLVLSLQAISSAELDWRRTVESNYYKVRTFARRAVDHADTPLGARILHVDYRQLVRDPVALARDIHQRIGLPFTPSHEAALTQFAAENRQHKHGLNRYKADDYGLAPAMIARDFADYRERFLAADR